MRAILIKRGVLSILILVAMLLAFVPSHRLAVESQQGKYDFPDYDPEFEPKPEHNVDKERFKLNQNYPQQREKAEHLMGRLPWNTPKGKLDFRNAAQWKDYLRAVLEYSYEGNTNPEVNWVVQKNTIRPWFHAPWLHSGGTGREPLHGMTYELASEPYRLSPSQNEWVQNWAISVYNAPGGFIIGRVWANKSCPDPTQAVFPNGTVAIKLLFTQASEQKVRYLSGQNDFKWNGYIYAELPRDPRRPDRTKERKAEELRLLQIDLAVRDNRSPTGWVFGTFVYHGQSVERAFTNCAPKDSRWCRVVPIGLMWGNDPALGTVSPGSIGEIRQSYFNSSNELPQELMATTKGNAGFGFGGRLIGPVDDRGSSCLSCHATASWPQFERVPPKDLKLAKKMYWFRNIMVTEADRNPFWEGTETLDYSLQLSAGLRNFYLANSAQICPPKVPTVSSDKTPKPSPR